MWACLLVYLYVWNDSVTRTIVLEIILSAPQSFTAPYVLRCTCCVRQCFLCWSNPIFGGDYRKRTHRGVLKIYLLNVRKSFESAALVGQLWMTICMSSKRESFTYMRYGCLMIVSKSFEINFLVINRRDGTFRQSNWCQIDHYASALVYRQCHVPFQRRSNSMRIPYHWKSRAIIKDTYSKHNAATSFIDPKQFTISVCSLHMKYVNRR